MHRRLLHVFHSTAFVRYVCIGGFGAVLDMGSLILFRDVLLIPAVLAVMLNQVLILSYSFLGMKHITFKNTAIPHQQLVRYLILVGINYILAVLLMYLFHTKGDIDYRLVRIGSMGLSVCWNFFLYKYWIFR